MDGDLDALYQLINELIRIRLSEVAVLEKLVERTPTTAEIRSLVKTQEYRIRQLEAALRE